MPLFARYTIERQTAVNKRRHENCTANRMLEVVKIIMIDEHTEEFGLATVHTEVEFYKLKRTHQFIHFGH